MTRSFSVASVVSILLVLAGCNGGSIPAVDGGAADSAVGPDSSASGGDSGPEQDAGSDAGRRPDAATESTGEVHWVTEFEGPTRVEGDVGYDYAFEYLLTIDGDPFVYSLEVERCIQLAGMAESCDTGPLSNLPGSGRVRFGVDPSMYAVGENHYRFHLTLSRGADVVSEDTLDLQYDVISCIECVGSGT